jgi:DnaJ-class molecular chaperone
MVDLTKKPRSYSGGALLHQMMTRTPCPACKGSGNGATEDVDCDECRGSGYIYTPSTFSKKMTVNAIP